MAKRKTWALGGAGLLIGAGIIVVIVLAALGYFNKKSGGSTIFSGGVNTGYIPKTKSGSANYMQPGYETCMPPQILNVEYSAVNREFIINHTGFSEECAANDSRYAVTVFVFQVDPQEAADGAGHIVIGETSSSAQLYPNVNFTKGVVYTGEVTLQINTVNGDIKSTPFSLRFVA